MGLEPAVAHGSLRLSLGRGTTAGDVERTIEVTHAAVGRLRAAAVPRSAAVSA
jgi:cysteine sulfinate desulfinase/cysteine desulfurase-like protein